MIKDIYNDRGKQNSDISLDLMRISETNKEYGFARRREKKDLFSDREDVLFGQGIMVA